MNTFRTLLQPINALSIRKLAFSTLLAMTIPSTAFAQSDASLTLSALPLASVVVVSGTGVSVAGAASTAALVLPAALSVAGSTLVVVSVEVLATSTVYVLERASDAARVSIRVATKTAQRRKLIL